MATVYILYSLKLDKYYTGSCINFQNRLEKHLNKSFANAYTTKSDDWEPFLVLNQLEYKQARKIESHIKQMKRDQAVNLWDLNKSDIFGKKVFWKITS